MRLSQVSHGHAFKERWVIRLMGWISKYPVPDVIRALLYRRDFFGDAFSRLVQNCLRGPHEWTVGERELFAAFTARLEQCRF